MQVSTSTARVPMHACVTCRACMIVSLQRYDRIVIPIEDARIRRLAPATHMSTCKVDHHCSPCPRLVLSISAAALRESPLPHTKRTCMRCDQARLIVINSTGIRNGQVKGPQKTCKCAAMSWAAERSRKRCEAEAVVESRDVH